MEPKTKTVAELQAERKALELDCTLLKTKSDDVSKAKLEAKEAKLAQIDTETKLAELQAADTKRRETAADEAIKAMEGTGLLAPQGDADRKAMYRKSFTENPDSIQLIAGEAIKKTQNAALNASAALGGTGSASALSGRTTPVAGALTCGSSSIQTLAIDAGSAYKFEFQGGSAGWNVKEALQGYAELVYANGRLKWNGHDSDCVRAKSETSLAAGYWFKQHLQARASSWENIRFKDMNRMVFSKELKAGDYTDPNSELGTLSGTLVLQRTLPVFAWLFPEFGAMTTDFSDAPGLFQQAERTRIVTQASVVVYTTTLVAANNYVTSGVPQGWQTAVEGTDTDVTLTLTDYIGVPIAIGNNILAATTRRLFDEQAVLAIKAIAQYLAGMVTNLFVNSGSAPNSATSFNYYQTANGTTVPIAYPSYPVNSQTFNMRDIDNLDAAMTSAKVPEDGRFLLLNPLFYSRLRGDTRLEFLYAASAKDVSDSGAGQFLTEARLPKLSGFAPYKAGYMPTAAPQPTVVLPNQTPTLSNIVGFAGHKAGIIMKARVPTDIQTSGINAQAPGTITTVTDPDTGISIMLVQFINLLNNVATWRPEVMLGTTIGDNRGGIVLTGS